MHSTPASPLRRIARSPFLLLLLSLSAARAGDWTLTKADLSRSPGASINTWSAADGLSLTDSTGKLTTVPIREIVELESGKKPSPPPSTGWVLHMRNGDVLYGDPAGMSGQSISIKTADLGTVNIPLKNAAELVVVNSKSTKAPAGGERDILRLGNGDSLEGIIAGMTADKLQIATGTDISATTDVSLSDIQRVVFGGVVPPRAVPPLSIRIAFTNGSMLTLPLDKPANFSWSLNTISFADPAGGDAHSTIADKVRSVEVLGGRIVFLSELDPAKDQQSTYLGDSFPTQINSSVFGTPLRAGGATFYRGLGVHTKSDITYDLDGSYESLSFRPALDDSAAPQGHADLSVLLDGKPVWQASLTANTTAAPQDTVTLPIKGAHQLTLHAESHDHLDIEGRVDWLNIALIRP